MKLTKRKGFNFFRSYYDVYNELNDKDKLEFINALLDRQFLGIKPEGLKGMAKFAYISQTNSIDSQVKGYEDKTRTKLNSTLTPPPTYGGNLPPTLQVEEKVEEKGEGEVGAPHLQTLLSNFNNNYNKAGNPIEILTALQGLPKDEQQKAVDFIPTYNKNIADIKIKEGKDITMKPINYLNSYCWNDKGATKKPITYE